MEHFDALSADADLVEQILYVFHSAFCVCITFQVMTGAFQSARDHDAIRAALERLERVQHVEFAGAGQQHDLDVGRVLNARCARQVCRRVRSKVAAESNQLWFKAVGCSHTSMPLLPSGRLANQFLIYSTLCMSD